MATQSKTVEEVKGHAKDAADTVSAMARDAAGTAKAKIAAKSEEAKDGLASEIHDTAAALRRAADEVRDGSPQGMSIRRPGTCYAVRSEGDVLQVAVPA